MEEYDGYTDLEINNHLLSRLVHGLEDKVPTLILTHKDCIVDRLSGKVFIRFDRGIGAEVGFGTHRGDCAAVAVGEQAIELWNKLSDWAYHI